MLVLTIVRRLGGLGCGLKRLQYWPPLKSYNLEYGHMADTLLLMYVDATFAMHVT